MADLQEPGADLKTLSRFLTGQMGHLLLGRGGALFFTFLIPVLLARALSVEDFGAYRQLFLLSSTYLIILRLGLESSLYYFLPREPLSKQVYIGQTVLIYTIIGAFVFLLSFLIDEPVARLLGNPSLSRHIPLITLFTAMMLVAALTENIMICLRDAQKASRVMFSFEAMKTLLLTAPALLFGSVTSILYGAVAVAAGRLIYLAVYLSKGLRISLGKITCTCLGAQFRYALPFWVAGIFAMLADYSHLYLVSYFFGVTSFAIYSVGFFQIPVLAIVIESVIGTSMVSVAEYAKRGSYDTVGFIVSSVTKKLFIVFLPLFFWLFICSRDFILMIYTDKFEASVPIFLVSLFLLPISAFDLSYVLRSMGNTTYILGACVFRLGMTILLILCLSRYFQLRGVVMGVVAAQYLVNGVFLIKVMRVTKLTLTSLFPPKPLAQIIVTALVASSFTALIRHFLHAAPAVALTLSFGAFFAVYTALILYLRLIDEEVAIFRVFLKKRFPGRARHPNTDGSN